MSYEIHVSDHITLNLSSRPDEHNSIRGALNSLCQQSLNSFGLPAFHRIYTGTPLVVPKIHELGIVRVPLNARQFAVIRQGASSPSSAEPAQGLRYDIEEFSIVTNTEAWNGLMNQIARETCEVLGFDYEANAPCCKILELFIEPSGSIPHIPQYSASCDGLNTLANVILVLPSRYTGGAMHISHEEQRFSYDFHTSTAANIRAIAWRREASLQMDPLTSGFRILLSMALVSTSPHPVPPLPLQPDALSQIHSTFARWQQARRANAPTKLVRLLGRKYNMANVRKAALHGSDARFVSVLSELARMYSFKVGLAVLACRLHGERLTFDSDDSDEDDDSEHTLDETERKSDDSYSMSSDQDHEEGSSNSTEVVDSTLPPLERLVTLADLEGNILQDRVHCGDDTQVYPDRLQRTFSSPSHQLFDDLPSSKRCFALVVWPSWADFDLHHGHDAFSEACQQLQSSTGNSPNTEELELVDLIMARASPSSRAQVIGSVCRAACAWRDETLWGRALDACEANGAIESLVFENVCDAVKTFGFVNVQARIEGAMERDPSDLAVLQFLRDLEVWMSAEMANDPARLDPLPADRWIASQRRRRLQLVEGEMKRLLTDLHRAEPSEMTSIVAVAAVGGAPDLLFECIVPGIVDATANVTPQLVSAVIDEMSARRQSLDPAGGMIPSAVGRLLHKFTASIDLRALAPSDIPRRVADALEYCLRHDVPAACGSLLRRVAHPEGTDVDKDYVKSAAVPVLEHLVPLARRYQLSLTLGAFAPFVRAVLSALASTVIGPVPRGTAATVLHLQAQLEKWACACEHCATVKTWLAEEPEAAMAYDRIGGAKRKHLEKCMKAAALGTFVTWETIMTSPQGIEVTKRDAVAAPVEWLAHVKHGLGLLQGLGLGARDLRDVLGEDAATTVRYFSGRSSADAAEGAGDTDGSGEPEDALSALLRTTAQSVVAQLPDEPSVPASPRPSPPILSAAAETERLSETPTGPVTRIRRSQASSSRQPGGEPQRKRRKVTAYEDDEVRVIDLT